MKVIGIGHYSRTGKDSFANFLVSAIRQRGGVAKKLSFAWKLKDITHQLYSWAGVREPEYYETEEGAIVREQPLVLLKSKKYPKGPTVVDLWIDLGTPAVRNNVYQNTWVDYVMQTDHQCDVLIIPDVRFPNEVDAVRDKGGTLIKVIRPGFAQREGSVADNALNDYLGWDGIIGRSGTLLELETEANSIAWDIHLGDKIEIGN